MDELQRISNRVTVMRDGRYIATVTTEGTSVDTIIAMMVGRQLENAGPMDVDTSRNEVVLEVQGLQRGDTIRDVSFQLRKGEILGFAGMMGAGRTEVARAIFGADPIDAGEIRVRGHLASIKSPADAVAYGIGYLSEDRKHFGLATGLDVKTNMALSSMQRFRKQGIFLDDGAIKQMAEQYVRQLSIKTSTIDHQRDFCLVAISKKS